MKTIQSLTCVALLCLASTSCVRVKVVTGVTESDLKGVATANQRGDIPAAMKVLDVDNPIGNVRVTGVESGPLEWSWKLTARGRTEDEARQAAQAANFRAESDGDKLMLSVELPAKTEAHYQSDIEIRAPKSMVVRSKTRYGRLTISGVAGDVEARNQSGAIEINNVTGKVHAQNSYDTLRVKNTGPAMLKNQSGELQVENIHGALEAETSYATLTVNDVDGFARLRNQSGRIELTRIAGNADVKTSYDALKVRDVKGDALLANQSGNITAESVSGLLKATTSYANLEISGVGGPNVVLQNQSGNIRVQGLSLTTTNLDARTSYASMDVQLPGDFKPALLARTTYAEIKSDFPLLKVEGDNPFAGVAPATPRVSLRNQSGDIRVTKD